MLCRNLKGKFREHSNDFKTLKMKTIDASPARASLPSTRKWILFLTVLVFYFSLYLLDKDTQGVSDIWNARVIPGLLFYFVPTYILCTVVFRTSGGITLTKFVLQLIATVVTSFLAIAGILLAMRYLGLLGES